MSALAGIWNFDGKPDAAQGCARMLSVQAIYGPHDGAQWDMDWFALGRRLFRLLPEDEHDQQPVFGGDGRFVLVADIRLDNREELISTLGIAPARGRDMADAAILLAAWERWQEASVDRLLGDYAFAVFDRNLKRLSLVRDPIGMRPLHYHRGGKFFAFASMPKGLHALPEIPRRPDEERIAEYLALLPEAGSQSYFKDVERVESGCMVTVTPDGVTSRRHWNPSRTLLKLKGWEDYAEALRHHLDRAVRARLRGAGNLVGSHLSSGFDSSSVTASAALQLGPEGRRVAAFTSVPREGYVGPAPHRRIGDEGPIAALTAARYPNIDHVLIRTQGRTPLDALDRSFFLYDRPVLNLCNNTWANAINDAAQARGVSVMLVGQMGNMSISYDGLTFLSELIRSGRWLRWLREGTALVRKRHQRVRNVMVNSFGPYLPLFLWTWINRTFRGVDTDATAYSAIRPELLKAMDLEALARERGLDLHYRPRTDGFSSRIWVIRRVDVANYYKGTLAGWGLDMRDPTADRRLLEFCLSVPEEQFLADGETKILARRAFADRLPPEVTQMRGKGYQAVDWHEGLLAARDQVAAELSRLDDCGPAANALDLPRLKRLLENVPTGGWERDEVMMNYRLAMLRGIAVGHFLRRASGSNA